MYIPALSADQFLNLSIATVISSVVKSDDDLSVFLNSPVTASVMVLTNISGLQVSLKYHALTSSIVYPTCKPKYPSAACRYAF